MTYLFYVERILESETSTPKYDIKSCLLAEETTDHYVVVYPSGSASKVSKNGKFSRNWHTSYEAALKEAQDDLAFFLGKR